MKKHLIGAAVIAAFAAPAMAQNVSLYGILDMNWNVKDYDVGSSQSTLGSSALATSRIGIRGSEDLGGGLKAEFMLEGTLRPQDGVVGYSLNTSNSTGTADTLFDRESWFGLAGSFGAVRFGTSDVTDAVNIDSKVSQAGDLGLITDLGTDKTRVARYTSPVMSGLSFQAGIAQPSSSNESSSALAVESNTNKIVSLYGAYEQKEFAVYVGHEIKTISPTYDQKQTTIGGKYDFGVASVGLAYGNRDGATSGASDRTYTALSAAVPLANGYKVHGVYKKYETDTTKVANDFDAVTLAVTKSLSKRTTAYAAYIDTDFNTNGATGTDNKNYLVGVTHAF